MHSCAIASRWRPGVGSNEALPVVCGPRGVLLWLGSGFVVVRKWHDGAVDSDHHAWRLWVRFDGDAPICSSRVVFWVLVLGKLAHLSWIHDQLLWLLVVVGLPVCAEGFNYCDMQVAFA